MLMIRKQGHKMVISDHDDKKNISSFALIVDAGHNFHNILIIAFRFLFVDGILVILTSPNMTENALFEIMHNQTDVDS